MRPPDLRSERVYLAGVAVSFVAVVVAGTVHLSHPAGVGSWALPTALVVLFLLFGFGPLLRGARPVRLWAGLAVGAVFSAAGISGHPLGVLREGDVLSDVFLVLGYVFLSSWFIGLSRRIGRITTMATLVDAAAAATAIVLTIWAIPRNYVDSAALPHHLQWAVYPVLDAVIFLLLGHLALSVGRRIRAWWWAFGAMGALLLLDLTQVYLGTGMTPAELDLIGTAYLLPYWGLAAAACHPSLPDLPDTPVTPPTGSPYPRRSALLYLTVFPGVASLALPSASQMDAQIRTALVLTLVALLFVRLLGTMGALASAERHSRFRASHDLVTGLHNRAALLNEIPNRLERNQCAGRSTALYFLDCDNFKGVNDTWGHPAGDALLRDIATRLPDALGHGDLVARHGGDEFVVVATVADIAEARDRAQRIHDFFEVPFTLTDEITHATTASIGVAVAGPDDDVSATELLERADVALYAAKTRGRAQFAVYDAALDRQTRDRSRIAQALKAGIDARDISVAFQPIVAGPGLDMLIGWEALARWSDPELGQVPPDVFIPLAEELGIIVDLDRTVTDKALTALATLHRDPAFAGTTVSVNVSGAHLQQADFTAQVLAALERTGIDPGLLVVDVSESLFVDDASPVLERLREARAAGIRVCIDDFGTGHASLTALLRSPVDSVKIDGSIVRRLDVSAQEAGRVQAIIRLLDRLGVPTVVAEGVEHEAQKTQLRDLGCTAAQGMLFGAPVPPGDIRAAAPTGSARG